jgi:hypothetical protein
MMFESRRTAVNSVKTETEQGKRTEPVVLLDCGQASKVTKGMPYMVLWELCTPPFDTTLL